MAFTKIVVWGTLLFSPCVMIAMGLMVPLVEHDSGAALVMSACLILPASLAIVCICCCWQSLVPFTVEVLHAVACVMAQSSGLVVVGAMGALSVIAWTLLVSISAMGVYQQVQSKDIEDRQSNALYFVLVLLMSWGGMVSVNACHVTYCGIFGRWYHGKEPSLGKSLGVAFGSSFGSVCLGSLIIATVRAADALLSKLRRDAREQNQNPAVLCLLCLLQCLVRCVEDVAEALSYFSYVQVAVRGFAFVPAVRATFALCTWKNIPALIACNLVNSVAALGSLFCGGMASFAALAVAFAYFPAGADEADTAFVAALSQGVGLLTGVAVAGNVLQALRSGFATLCVGFAEDEGKLMAFDQNLYASFQQRIGMSGAR